MSFCNLTPRHPVSWSFKEDKTRRVTQPRPDSPRHGIRGALTPHSARPAPGQMSLIQSPPVATVSRAAGLFTATNIKLRVWKTEPGQQRPELQNWNPKPKFCGFQTCLLPVGVVVGVPWLVAPRALHPGGFSPRRLASQTTAQDWSSGTI